MRRYDWKNGKTGEIRETDSWSRPPDLTGVWERVYSFGVGRVEGAGGTPGMPSTKLKGSTRGDG